MNEVMIGDLRIAYERAGEGPPLVLLHGGFGINSSMWRPQIDGLSDEFTVVAWDMPGAGRSSDPPEGFGASGYTTCLAAFIEALGLERPHVLGLSFGSVLALELYRRYPSIPRSLVLASAYAGWVGSLSPEMVEQRLQRALREADLPPEQWARGYVPGFFSESVPPALIEEVVTMMSNPHPAGLRAMALAFGKADLRDVLPRITVPTLLLYGEKDVRSPLQVAEDLHTHIPGSQLVVMPGVGHASNLEAPDLFNAEVRRFLRSLSQ
jgi:pimeloyl-ACP methyl ester carboxylesterase